MHRILYLLLLAGYLMVACRTGKKDAPAAGDAPSQQVLTFGSGGGFTGAVTTYTLHGDGQLHRAKALAQEPEAIGKLSRETTSGLFKKAEDLLSRTPDFNHPDNRYFFVKLGTGDAEKAITWGAPDHPAPAGLEAFYQELLQHTK